MPPTYPANIFEPRTRENKSGVVYAAEKKNVLFAEDVNKTDAEVVAVQTELGTLPKGSYTDVKTRLADAFTKTTANEISGLANKAVPADNDVLIIEDSAANYVKKKILKSTLGAGGSGVGAVPVGSVVAFLKTLTGCPALPADYVECNGQVLSDADSPFNSQTIPDLNDSGSLGDAYKRFLRGNLTSGGGGGSVEHDHCACLCACICGGGDTTEVQSGSGCYVVCCVCVTGGDVSGCICCANHLPPYYDVVWVMRIK